MILVAKKCAGCGGEIFAGALWGLCAKCLYREAVQLEEEDSTAFPERRLGEYQLVRPLGRGGMGIVYEAIQPRLRRRVALKMILETESASPVALRRFTIEAEAAAKLDHPNIVPIYEVGETDGQPFLSMKLIPGETLRKQIADGGISLRAAGELSKEEFKERSIRIARLMVRIAGAVAHAHDNGVIHRDLKPGNILMDPAGEPHLTDFGLAKTVQEEGEPSEAITVGGRALGTPSYMSPEQAEGARLTPASDLYSLGAILYEMLCGVPPFAAATPLETLRRLIEQEPARPRTLNPRLDKDLEVICLKCLEKNPAARYRGVRAMAEDLERWLRHEPIQARPAGMALRMQRWIARNPVGTALIASLFLGLVMALLLLRQSLDRQRKLDIHRANSLQQVSAEIEQMWKDPEKRSLPVPSETLADISDLPARQTDPLSTRIVFANAINDEPFGEAMQYGPFLNALEARMEKRLQRPVTVDLRLFKDEGDGLRETTRGTVHLERMSPVSYVLAKKHAPGLRALVREQSMREAVIFARTRSGISNLMQVAGKRLALGQPNSSATFWGKVHLARSGIRSADLARCVYLAGGSESNDSGPTRRVVDKDPNAQAQKRVIWEVTSGAADVGIVSRRRFALDRYNKGGLVALLYYPIPGEVYVASPSLPEDLARAFQDALLSFDPRKDREILRKIGENAPGQGFEPASDQDFESIRAALKEEIADFEGEPRVTE